MTIPQSMAPVSSATLAKTHNVYQNDFNSRQQAGFILN